MNTRETFKYYVNSIYFDSIDIAELVTLAASVDYDTSNGTDDEAVLSYVLEAMMGTENWQLNLLVDVISASPKFRVAQRSNNHCYYVCADDYSFKDGGELIVGDGFTEQEAIIDFIRRGLNAVGIYVTIE